MLRFWIGKRYRLTLEELGRVERAWVAREAEDVLVGKERAVEEAALRDGRAGRKG